VDSAEIITGADVKSAAPERSRTGTVHISLTTSGGQRILEATKKMQKGRSRLAIIYVGLIISAPVVGEILSSDFMLEGFSSFAEAEAVAAALNKPLSTNLLLESLMPLAR
jgi:preprotein translocase subunit SecD